MNNKLKKIAISTLISSFLIFSVLIPISISINYNREPAVEYYSTQNSELITKSASVTLENPIFIDGNASGVSAHNWSWAVTQGWCSGDGSWSTPYTIENVTIDAITSTTGNGIFINNSKNDYFIIRNVTVYNAGSGAYAGIKLQNTNNGTLLNNNCSNNRSIGILLFNSDNNTISGNIVTENNYYGIHLYSSDHNDIVNNTANNNGIRLDGLKHYQFHEKN